MDFFHQWILRCARWPWIRRRHPLTSPWKIICWWELRRPIYNLLVGAVGALGIFLLLVLARMDETTGPSPNDGPELFLWSFLIAGYGAIANLIYSGGWLVELMLLKHARGRAGNFGETAFVLGLFYSILITLIPVFLFSVLVLISLISSL